MPIPGTNTIVDISHHNNVTNWNSVVNAGIFAVVHKATEGSTYRDSTYHARKQKALDKGLRWGSYHFSSGADAVTQVENYLEYANPEDDELVCLDYEPSYNGHNMTLAAMERFVKEIKKALGRYPVIYGGSLLRQVTENIGGTILSECPLWFARYNNQPLGIPDPWPTWTLWQYTDGSVGPDPHTVPGIGHCDRDTFNGTAERLAEAWPLTHA